MERFRLGEGRKNQYWPDDMTDALAVMAPIPVGLSTAFGGVADLEMFGSYIDQWEEDVRASFGSDFWESLNQSPEFNFYLKPPAAGPYTDFVFTVVENVNAIVQTIDAYVWIGEALVALARRRKEHELPVPDEFSEPPVYLYTTIRGFEGLCLQHAHSRYYEPGRHPKISVRSTTRGEFFGSAQHPSAGVKYTVVVQIGKVDYFYVGSADARAFEHFSQADGEIHSLPIPDWFDERKPWQADGMEDVPPIPLGNAGATSPDGDEG